MYSIDYEKYYKLKVHRTENDVCGWVNGEPSIGYYTYYVEFELYGTKLFTKEYKTKKSALNNAKKVIERVMKLEDSLSRS